MVFIVIFVSELFIDLVLLVSISIFAVTLITYLWSWLPSRYWSFELRRHCPSSMALNGKDLIAHSCGRLTLLAHSCGRLSTLPYFVSVVIDYVPVCFGLPLPALPLGGLCPTSCAQSQLLLGDVAPAVPQLHCGSCPLLWVYQCGPYPWAPILLC